MNFGFFLWTVVRRSFHGALKYIEPAELLLALGSHTVGHYKPEWQEPLDILFVALLVAFVVTFLFGLFRSAYLIYKEAGDERRLNRLKAEFSRICSSCDQIFH